jgi:hypothetical protein
MERLLVAGQRNANTEVDLWQALIQKQEDYARSLECLDALAFEVPSAPPVHSERHFFEEAAEVRRKAYAEYRQAMDELAKYLRE